MSVLCAVYLSIYVPAIIGTSCARCVFINICTNNYMYVLWAVCIYQYMYQQLYVRPVGNVFINIRTSCGRCVFINICTSNYMYVLCAVCIYQYMYQYMCLLPDCLGVIHLLGVLLRLLLLSSSVIVCQYIVFFSDSLRPDITVLVDSAGRETPGYLLTSPTPSLLPPLSAFFSLSSSRTLFQRDLFLIPSEAWVRSL